jgi:hypothetical protein
MLKTLPDVEAEQLRRMLPGYVEYVARNPSTLLTRIYGFYHIRKGTCLSFLAVCVYSLLISAAQLAARA